jgi:hypothetical protein
MHCTPCNGLLESRLCMRYISSSLHVFKFFHFEFINWLCMFSKLYICEGTMNVWLQVNILSCVYLFVVHLHLVHFNSLCPLITQVNYGAFKTFIRFQIMVFFPAPPSPLPTINLSHVDAETLNTSPNSDPP